MREQIEESIKNLGHAKCACTNQILFLISKEIEKVEAEVEAENEREESAYYRGCEDACDKILALLRSK